MRTGVINLLRREERRARIRFWKTLALVSSISKLKSPFVAEPPSEAIEIGVLPRYLRGAFVLSYKLRAQKRQGEAGIYEEALSDLIQEEFRHVIRYRRVHGESEVRSFIVGKDWKVYILPA